MLAWLTKNTRVPDDQHPYVWSQVHAEKQDAGYLVGLQTPTDTDSLCACEVSCAKPRGGFMFVRDVMWTHMSIMLWISASETTCQNPQCVNNQISCQNGCNIKCCVVSPFSSLPSFHFLPTEAGSPVCTFSSLHVCTEWACMAPWNTLDTAV